MKDRDPELLDLARRRASFSSHLAIYLIVNLFLWALWYFTDNSRGRYAPWPIWSTLGWGIGLASHYVSAYVSPGRNSVDRHYEKLLRERQDKQA